MGGHAAVNNGRGRRGAARGGGRGSALRPGDVKRGADPVRRLRAGSVANGLGTVVFGVGNFLAVAAITRYENLRVAGGLFVLLAAYLVLITILQFGVPVGLARCLPQVAAGRSGAPMRGRS